MSHKGGADKDLFSHISATYSLNAFFGLEKGAHGVKMLLISIYAGAIDKDLETARSQV